MTSGWDASAGSIQVSMPAEPPEVSPYFWRRVSRIGPSEGYFSFVSTVPLRSTASIAGVEDSPVFSVAPSVNCGCTTVGSQSTRALPVVRPRTTVNSEA
ncbi:hypothetical protein GA0115255_123255 [Streptomyces sp. Ncost-T6T-2b]|nr:hypothetical protein GA0115255_123255 [Streptomyces sp. Ncost-T6T-2b]